MGVFITIANEKGGVGKTTTALNLAAGLALRFRRLNPDRPKKVLVIDLDPTAATLMGLDFGRHVAKPQDSLFALLAQSPPPSPQRLVRPSAHHENLDYIPTNSQALESLIKEKFVSLPNRERRLERALRPVLDEYEFIICDTPPTYGYMVDNALVASRYVIVPVEASYLGVVGLVKIEQVINFIKIEFEKELEILGFVPLMVDRGQSEPQEILDALEKRYPGRVLQPIHRSVDIKYAHSAHMDVFTFRPGRGSADQLGSAARQATKEFGMLVEQVAQLTATGVKRVQAKTSAT